MAMEDKFYTPSTTKALLGFIGGNNEPQLVGKQATYSIAVPDYAPYATPTDMFVLLGSATKTIKIIKVNITGGATSASLYDIYLIKRTADNTDGTRASVAASICEHDTRDDAATAVPYTYSVIPSALGAGKTYRSKKRHFFPAATPAANSTQFDQGIDLLAGKPITLRGVTELFAINGNAAAVPSGLVLTINVEWVEE